MIRRLREKSPVLLGIVLGYGLMFLFVLMEVILVKTGISNCGLVIIMKIEKCGLATSSLPS